MKTYERAFLEDLKSIDKFEIEPTYDEDGIPTSEGFLNSIEKNFGLQTIFSGAVNQPEDSGNNLIPRAQMAPFWKAYGRPIFNITPELAAALIMSDLPSDLSCIKVPFPAFILSIQVPPGQDTPLVIDGKDYFGVALFNMTVEEGRQDGYLNTWSLWALPRMKQDRCHYQRIVNPMTALHDWVTLHPESASVHRLIINLLAYISARKQASTLPKPVKTRMGSRKGTRVTKLGSDVKLPYNLIYAARGKKDPRYKLSKRFVVMGHWRNQPYGPRADKKVRTIWITPFWKGPDILESTERKYTVK